MPNYRFRAHDNVTSAEKLGAAILTDDDEALAFAERVIRELMQRDAKLYATWTMEVTVGKRSVASVPFESVAGDGNGITGRKNTMPTNEQLQHCARINQQLTDAIPMPGAIVVIRKDTTEVVGRLAAHNHPTVTNPISGSVTIEASDSMVVVEFLNIESIFRMPANSD